MSQHPAEASARPVERLPVEALLALATVGFVAIMTETVPAGLLPSIAAGLGTSPAVAGQLVTAYASGSVVAAIPLMALTLAWRRRSALLLPVFGLALANGVTAFSSDVGIAMLARLVGGFSSGLAWGLVASYARLLAPARLQGRALALAMTGTPVALSIGVPAGTMLGDLVGWRATFGLMSGASVALCGWIVLRVPDFPGRTGGIGAAIRAIAAARPVHPVLFVVFAWMLAHNVLYTYVASIASRTGLGADVIFVLLVFGMAALIGIFIAGRVVDRHLFVATLASLILFTGVAVLLIVGKGAPTVVLVGTAVWGMSFGGASTFLNTAAAEAAPGSVDMALASVTTTWNAAIASGGLLGGVLLASAGPDALSWAALAFLIPSILVVALPWGRVAFTPISRS